MKIFFKPALFILFISAVCWRSASAQSDFDKIKSRIIAEVYGSRNAVAIAKAVLPINNQNADGSWSDVDYANRTMTTWKPVTHLNRLLTLAIAYTHPESPYNGNAGTWQNIVSGLQYWQQKDPRSNNWWHNDIAAPQQMGRILVTMSAGNRPLPQELLLQLTTRMAQTQSPLKFTGANKLDIATHYIYRALVTNDEKLMDTAVAEAFQPVKITTQEGLQHDYSYQQHKEQLMISSYGFVFLTGEYQVAAWMAGTKFAIPQPQLQILNNFFFNTFIPSMRGSYTDYNTEGRGISRNDILDKKKLAASYAGSLFQNIATADPSKKQALEAIRMRIAGANPASYNIESLHTYFWKGDYTIHQRPKYSFNVRTVSTRTVRTETGNGENILGTVLPDGSINLVRRGDEYYNIMPLWEWDKIPGVTARNYDTAATVKVQWGEYGSTIFTGGVSDSLYGATVYTLDYDGVVAKKGYFFFDDEVVCLGAGISSSAPQNITTAINQAWNNGDITLGHNGKQTALKKHGSFSNLQWVWHDSIAYILPNAQCINILAEKKSAPWKTVNNSSKGTAEGRVFKMWIDHGLRPQNEAYAYIVVPGITIKETAAYKTPVQIIKNEESLQAVAHQGSGILQSIFYKPGKLEYNGMNIEVMQSCILQLRRVDGGKMKLSVADPAQQQKEITLNITTASGKRIQRTISMPQAPYGGQTVAQNLVF